MTKVQLQQCNNMLDKTCQDLELKGIERDSEIRILKSIISLLMTTGEYSSKIIKLQTPKAMHIKIEDDYCIITMVEEVGATDEEKY